MKKLIILSAIALSSLIYNTADAQIGIRVGFHFGPRRVYAAPAVVEQAPVYADNDDDYYYLPDVDAYYSVNEQCYYYFDGDNWISAAYLPGEYRDYDWRSARRFEVREARPYLRDDVYRSRYHGNIGNWARNYNYNRSGYANSVPSYSYGYGRSNSHFNNRVSEGYNRSNWSNGAYKRGGNDNRYGNRNQGNYAQPSQPERNRGGNDQHSGNFGRGNYSQPINQNNDQHQGNRGGGENRGQGSPQRGFGGQRMARF